MKRHLYKINESVTKKNQYQTNLKVTGDLDGELGACQTFIPGLGAVVPWCSTFLIPTTQILLKWGQEDFFMI